MWNFRKKRPSEKIRNPIQGEFFSQEAIEGPSEALIRESIQNSLDARDSGRVCVRVGLYGGDQSLPGSAVNFLFELAWPHYGSKNNGLIAAPKKGDACEFLVVEDFGTKGLNGDPAQSDPDPDPSVKNPFFLFFRAEGLSAKSGEELGRWGVGKFVFARSSLASTHFGVTVRSTDGKRLLLGASTLKAHYVDGDPSLYSPDGMFGVESATDPDFILPIEDQTSIDSFCSLFRIRRASEPGLSVVVPFVDPDITYSSLLSAVVRGYFFPILKDRLQVDVTDGRGEISLTASTIGEISAKVAAEEGVAAQIALAKFALGAATEDFIEIGMPDAKRSAAWSEGLIDATALGKIRSLLSDGKAVAIRCPVTVRSKRDGDFQSYFDVFLVKDKAADGRPVFIREGIVISDIRGRRAREFRSLVIIEDRALATMLGDSENPAHTQWQKDSSNFKGKYIYGPGLIQYVADSVGAIMGILSKSDSEADSSLTIDFFSLQPPEDSDEARPADSQRVRPKPGVVTPEDETEIPKRPTRVTIQREPGGFVIRPGAAVIPTPYLLDVRCAYDIRSGNPLRKWNAADFVLASASVPLICSGNCQVLQVRGNGALLRIDGPTFEVRVNGFDVNRDIYVKVDVKEIMDADPEA